MDFYVRNIASKKRTEWNASCVEKNTNLEFYPVKVSLKSKEKSRFFSNKNKRIHYQQPCPVRKFIKRSSERWKMINVKDSGLHEGRPLEKECKGKIKYF